jgi:tetratricopeptide (TPR) repeat protein
MKKFIPLACLILICCVANNAFAQLMRMMPDSATMRKEWQKTIDRTTQDMGLSYNHQAMGSILYERADAEANLKRYSKAIDDYNKAIFFDPALKQVYRRRAAVYERMGNFRAAIGDYEKTLAGIQNDKLNAALIWNFIAGDQYMLGNFSKAVKADSTAIILMPEFYMAYVNKAGANMQLGKFQQAVDDFTSAAKGYQNSPADLAIILKNRGDAYHSLEKFSDAINDYTTALQYEPGFKACYWSLAVCYGKMGQYLLAENNFARSATIYKDDNQSLSRLYVDWAGLEEIRRDYAKEITNDSLAVAYDNKNPDAYGALAHAYALNGRLQKSIDCFNGMVKFYKTNNNALLEIYTTVASEEFLLGNYDQAIQACNAAIAINKQVLPVYIDRGRAYLKKANNDLATADFNKVLAADTNKHSYAYISALFFTGKQDQAISIMQADAANNADKRMEVYQFYHLARMFSLVNKPDEANAYLKKSIAGGYSPKYALTDPDLDNIRNTPDFKDATAGK